MTQPLALVLYERLLPGSQVVNRLQDLNYRVHTLSSPERLVQSAIETKPLVVLADLDWANANIHAAFASLKQNPATQHLPIIAFGSEKVIASAESAKTAGITLLVGETAILQHLPQILDQAVQVE
jgi:PleD family two-component response regulator